MKISPFLLGLSLAVTGSSLAAAQDTSAKPPAVLQITREYVKPGKGGLQHDKSEAAFVALVNKAKLQGHYVALNSMSGKSRALYIARYPSFAAWEADNKIVDKNPGLNAEFDRAAAADGDLLESLDQSVFTYDEDLSYHPHPDISHARYYEITVFHVRPGHRKDWYDVTKAYKEANDKAGTTQHWAAYEMAYGGEAGTYIAITARDSMAEIDTGIAEGKKIMAALGGEEGMRKLDEAFWAALDSAHSEFFAINPKQSYPEEQWLKGDPEFWKPKAGEVASKTTKPAATASAKPAAAPAPPKPASR
jgi:hypothetical protein